VRREFFAKPRAHAIPGTHTIALDPRAQGIVKAVLAEAAERRIETALQLPSPQQHVDAADQDRRGSHGEC
jgi:hypothetical protein